ncbi:portal protein [Gordonia phage Asapag]|uniref:Portal protein n=2 Tax=Getalongvirus TaxID=2733156 RepID=A0A410TDP5_9CAUD|nr:portal protein [Gordonia phage BENtherdunthat]YP_009819049.1 portal protein [Gordonia phage Asapag]ATW60774.1 portal protein [Gordonia phage BENtherdunthat]QAU07157.1 portal protein [Gordonia phage Asapag]QYC53671.1 portal protein [Gordonia phage Leroy]
MDAITVRIPELSSDENALVNGLLGEIERLRLTNLLRTSYYDNKRTIRMVGTLIPPQYFNLGLTLGWTGKAVDALARRCNLDGFVWADGDLASIGGLEVWNDNHLASEVDGAVVAAMNHGPAFLINTMGQDDEPESLIHVKDATEATGVWNRRRRHLDNLLSVIDKDKDGRVLTLALYIENETITAQRDKATSRWQVDRSEHVYGVPAEVLPYKPSPRRPFGQSRITQPIMGLQDAAVRELIRREGHMDVFSYPEFWLLGADETVFKNADGTQRDMWNIRLGRIKGINDDKDVKEPQLARADVKQFPAASPEAHWADINGLAKLFAREAQLPDSAVAISEMVNPTSAESYDASQYELIAEAEGADDNFTPALRNSFIRALAMKNRIAIGEIPEAWKSIDTQWRNPRYLSRAAVADAGMKQLAAAPELAGTEVGYELLGLTPQQIKRALSERRRATGRQVLDTLRQQTVTADAGDADRTA